jgi:hypothetical protein
MIGDWSKHDDLRSFDAQWTEDDLEMLACMLYSESDVADYSVMVRVECPGCKIVRDVMLPAETIGDVEPGDDSIYRGDYDEFVCSSCSLVWF